MIYAQKIQLIITKEQGLLLDSQSKKCNWLYNQLLQQVNDDYENNNSEKKLLSGRNNLRDLVTVIKEENSFLKTIHSSPLRNAAVRLKDSFVKFFKDKAGEVGHPKFRSWKKKWFSLLYDEPFVGYKLDEKNLRLSLGKSEEGKNFYINIQLVKQLKLKLNSKVKNLRIIKENNMFFAVFTIEKEVVQQPVIEGEVRWIALDPNHKNMMVGVDYKGRTIEYFKLQSAKYWDKNMDELRSKIDRCKKKTKFCETQDGRGYYKNSRRWNKYNDAMQRASSARREQIKQPLYSVSNDFAQEYDLVLIGDYVPSTETAKYKNMHRSMLNQTFIGQLRKTIDWVMLRSNKRCIVVDERNTTKECPFCSFMEHKDPSIRHYTCPKCGMSYYRDIGSSINIAVKEKMLLRSDYKGWFVEQPMYTVAWDYRSCKWSVVPGGVADESKGRDWPLVLAYA